MKMKIYLTHIFMPLILAALTCVSCNKFLDIEPPENQAELSKVFADDQSATSATVGLYYQMAASSLSFCNGGITLYAGLSADEITNSNPSPSHEFFRDNSILTNNTTINSTFWSNPFKNIYHANAVLEGLNNSAALTPSVKKQLRGEMLYVRALHYFFLVNLFGDIPLQTGTDYEVNGLMPRTPSAKVYDQVVADLLEARLLLSDSYAASTNTRPNKDAAAALLARVYLFLGRWQDAEIMASEVILSGRYSLEPLNNVFLSGSKESIFSITKVSGNVSEGATFIPSSATVRPTFSVTSHLLQAFETGDNRKAIWLKSNTVSGTPYFYPFKYKARTATPITEWYIVQRLAELYLIRAEARAELNNLSAAIDDIDLVRARAGLIKIKTSNPAIGKNDLLIAILKERRVELFAEWGHRWLDLKRTGTINAVLGPVKAPNWQPADALYPIPLAEILKNPSLSQNDGYTN
ncbi:RagB/SusD family nutrient uptake outer membrane protein [Pedobacter sp. ISL-68]|uniref:RagB/SusD family nutrient uptake outer membrane protein n=1 Tax=unclassified Pedobacter TaxID=2628915 RepID=UPI001BE8E752|nr:MULTISPECIES: RagB/SusD family nutrient uptake outer membrane protein [unclassified Pedobacter]MBT2561316.1 RagB/SusD family nutrient uptake outer membrane protein [Pedobacter sp. ISL-64]MBT2590705.1 RagB/SusD family nutrient uptake outer membrane protein [Pedobacter sp. ISL-68]